MCLTYLFLGIFSEMKSLQNLRRSQDTGQPDVSAADYISGALNATRRCYTHSGEGMTSGIAQRALWDPPLLSILKPKLRAQLRALPRW